MVNTGHPSRACKTCRVRRIKCDEAKPACMKCRKYGRVCPGYQSAFDLKIRDETQSVIRKAKMAHRRSASEDSLLPQLLEFTTGAMQRRAKSDRSTFSFTTPWVRVPYARSGAESLSEDFKEESDLSFGYIQLGWSLDVNGNQNAMSGYLAQLTTPLDQQATCFFLSNFVLSPPKGLGHGFFTFLLTLLGTPAAHFSPLSKAFSAVSMAALSGRPNSKTLLNRAQEYYTEAIVKLNESLRDPARAKEDATLAAVILLAFYEGLTSTDDKLSRWSTHLDGAKTLLQMRGPLEIFTEEGFAMFEFIRASMVAAAQIRQYMFHQVLSRENITWLISQGVTDRVENMSIVLNLTTCVYSAEADKLLGPPNEPSMAEFSPSLNSSPTSNTSHGSLAAGYPINSSPASGPDNVPLGSPLSFHELNPASQAAHVTNVRKLMHNCIANDRQLGNWLSECPQRWRSSQSYIAPNVPDSELSTAVAFPGPVLNFPNIWVAGKILIIHASKIVLSGIIMRCARWLQIHAPGQSTNPVSPSQAGLLVSGPEEEVNISALKATASVQIRGVLSSVPYFCSWCGDRATTPYFPCGTPENPKGFAGISCLWPMFAAGACEFSTERERKYIRARLRSISDTMGIRQTDIFARCLQTREYVPHLEEHEVMGATSLNGNPGHFYIPKPVAREPFYGSLVF